MVTLDRYLRDFPPNEGGRLIKDHKNYPLGVAVEKQLIDHFIQFFILSNYKAINVLSGELYQGDPDLYWSFTFYSFNKVAENKRTYRYDKDYPLSCRPTRQCFRALTLTPKCLIPSLFSYFCGWPLVNTGKNNKKGKPWAANGWLRSLNKGGHLLKMTITMFVLYAGKFGTLKIAR